MSGKIKDKESNRLAVATHRERQRRRHNALVLNLIEGPDASLPKTPAEQNQDTFETAAPRIAELIVESALAGDQLSQIEILKRTAPPLRAAAPPLPVLPGWPKKFESQDDVDAGVAELARAAGSGELNGEDAKALSIVLAEVAKAIRAREEGAALSAIRQAAERKAIDGDGARAAVQNVLRRYQPKTTGA